MIKHVVVVEDFEGWNEWFKDGKVPLDSIKADVEFHPNQGVVLKGAGAKEHGLVKGGNIVRIKQYYPCSIIPKNTEQTIALGLLNDHDISLVVLSGQAGSGKTLMACAHALNRLNGKDKISKIVIAKSMTPVGREIGFLKGSMEDKVMPWLGAYTDNFINCGYDSFMMEKLVERGQLEVTPLTYIQGRSISNAVIIIDEVQNLDMNIIKQIVTRAAAGTQVILLGDQTQMFERVATRSIDLLLEKSKNSPLVGAIHLNKTLRSPLAEWAVKNL